MLLFLILMLVTLGSIYLTPNLKLLLFLFNLKVLLDYKNFACPYTHEQNNSTKRIHKHITKVGLALFIGSYLPKKFWGEAFLVIANIINALPIIT